MRSSFAKAPGTFHACAWTHLCGLHGPGLALGLWEGAEQFSAEAGVSNAMCLEGDGEELLVQEQIEAINI